MNCTELQTDEFLPYFKVYIDKVGAMDLLPGLKLSLEQHLSFFRSIPEDKLGHSYAEDKWTIKEIISHLIDTERIFSYRALRFARQDKTVVAGFEQDDYVENCNVANRTLDDLLDEYEMVRQASFSLFKSCSDKMLLSKGIAGSGEISVRALGFLIIGHEKHHVSIIKERYL